MNEQILPELLNPWNFYGMYVSVATFSIGILILLFYFFKLGIIKEQKIKYNYISSHEISILWRCVIFLLIGSALFITTIFEKSTWIWFFVRFFMCLMGAIIVGVIVENLLKFYYPFFIEKRLKKLRYAPRISPDGRKMKLLSEEEEDVYLDEGMQAEEEVFSIDYDVWLDEESGYTKIEKYNGRLHAIKCPNCNYQTLKVDNEEIVQEVSEIEDGELLKHYVCNYCSYKIKKSFKIHRRNESGNL